MNKCKVTAKLKAISACTLMAGIAYWMFCIALLKSESSRNEQVFPQWAND